jgi:hypothetical protein
MPRLTPRALVAGALVLAALAGCGDDDATSTTDTTDTADTADTADATTTTEAAAPGAEPVAVTAVDYSFEGLPEEVVAGTALTLANDSAEELHELVALRLPDDETRSVEELLALPMEELEAMFTAPPALVAVAPPGEDGFPAVGDGRLAEPGRYAVLCFIPTGADPQAYLDQLEANPGQPPQVEGGPPHFTAGMYAELAVT